MNEINFSGEGSTATLLHMVTEGSARIIAGNDDSGTFYNPVQEFNRDLTITVLRTFVDERNAEKHAVKSEKDENSEPATKQRKINSKSHDHHMKNGGIRVLDALSASGLRAIRFVLEVPNVEEVLANDFSEKAFITIQRNLEMNGVQGKVKPTCSDAIDLMMEHRKYEKRFHAVDLDPYGSASPFLDAAVQAVSDGGLLMVTCTDTAILCGNTPEACFNKYGSVPLRHKSCHELSLRILLRSIDSHANRYKRYIIPLLSVSVDFYIRCFVKIFSGAAAAKDSVTKLAHVYSCATCQSLDFQPLIRKQVNGSSIRFSANHFQTTLIRCSDDQNTKTSDGRVSGFCAHCGGTSIHTGGPIWVAPMHDPNFVEKLIKNLASTTMEKRLGTHERLEGVLTVISEELHDVPLYYEHDQLMNVVKCPAPKMSAFRSALLNANFRCSISHCNPKAIKTDAPLTFLWDICREWAKQNGIKHEESAPDSLGRRVLAKEIQYTINFATHPNAIPKSKFTGLLRFPDNKGKNWGPKMKAKCSLSAEADYPDKELRRLASVENDSLTIERVITQRKSTSQPTNSRPAPELFPKTPEHYWDVSYPTKDEQIHRGYLMYAKSPLFKKAAKRRIF